MNSRIERLACMSLVLLALIMGAFLIKRGHGCDGDFPRHVINGTANLDVGAWQHMSRPPFPLMDLFHGAATRFFGTDDYRLNILSYLAAFFNLFLFGLIYRQYQTGSDLHGQWRALALMAVHPVFVVASGTRGDYIFSLMLVQGAWLCSLRGDLAMAAVLTGVASGFRMSNCLWALPLTWIAWRQHGTYRAAGYAAASAVVGFLAWLGPLMKLHFDVASFATGYSELTEWGSRIKSAVSKILAFWGLPLLITTLVFCRRAAWQNRLDVLRRYPELGLALILQYAVFFYLPSELGYLISTLPLMALLLPVPDSAWKSVLQVSCVFLMNIAVLDLQNKIPTKLHLSHGYYVAEFTCKGTDSCLEHMRFSYPRGYSPVGDWASAARVGEK